MRAVATGNNQSCAVLKDGRLRCFGPNPYGEIGVPGAQERIGDDELAGSLPPLAFPEPVRSVDVSFRHSCALTEGGQLYCFGEGLYGKLGYGSTENIGDDEWPSEAGPVPLPEPAIQVALGKFSTCALLQGGQVRCWGRCSAARWHRSAARHWPGPGRRDGFRGW
ncbi:MAG: chromosome condensation regulator, partial [Deltaproteobacteria bacterium]|nr:chromosome condensation regulator [Deltaproteobacteria bacterium]